MGDNPPLVALCARFARHGDVSELNVDEFTPSPPPKKTELGQLAATAIAGCDISSSIYYLCGAVALSAGIFSPISMVLTAVVLYFFRFIYAEVGEALPLNGGTYNLLLNATAKLFAALAGGLTILSYVATAVVSAGTGLHYFHSLVVDPGGSGSLPPYETRTISPLPPYDGTPTPTEQAPECTNCTIGLMALFAGLTLLGLRETSAVSSTLFVLHIGTLILLALCGTADFFIVLIRDGWDRTYAADNLANWRDIVPGMDGGAPPTVAPSIFYGFCSSFLGVTGFESCSNYIESQKPGVYPKTLRNMWIITAIFNPYLVVVMLATMPLHRVYVYHPSVLARMTNEYTWLAIDIGGQKINLLHVIVSLDSALVLAGAVLTSFVGVSGLVSRMALDRCLPQILLLRNRRGATYVIIIAFFVLTSSLYAISQGDVRVLDKVYTVSFLCVMMLFALGNLVLKYKRASLPRTSRASTWTVLVALVMCGIALGGNIAQDTTMMQFFVLYYGGVVVLIIMMFTRTFMLNMIANLISRTRRPSMRCLTGVFHWARRTRDGLHGQAMGFWSSKGSLYLVNKAAVYASRNEVTFTLYIIHCVEEDDSEVEQQLRRSVKIVDEMYPWMQVSLLLVKRPFCPETVDVVHQALGVPKNFMFIACPGRKFPWALAEFGGLRLITH